MDNLKYVGKDIPRIDGLEKVTGAAKFVDDIDFGNNLLYAYIIESPYAHALIKKIDTKEAEMAEGVVRVVTGADFPYKFGLYMKDRYILAQDRVRFVGEQVAAVIAHDKKSAERAAKLVRVEYQQLPSVLSGEDAMKDNAPLLHPDLENYPHVPWFFPKSKTNIAHLRKIRKGDTDKGFGEADAIIEGEYRVPRYAHCAIETHGAVGLLDNSGRLTLWTASQSPHTQRNLFAEALSPLGFTHKDVRVITPYVGGGFGGKAGVTMEILAAAFATKVKGDPIKIIWNRRQEFNNTYQRQGLLAKVKIGVKKDGRITALSHTLYWDAGAYVEYGANVVNAVGLSATGPYKIDNLKIDSYCIYTNLPPGGPYRGFGYSEFHFGLESSINQAAKAIKMDPVKLRRMNAIREGDILAYGGKMNPNGLIEAIDSVAKEIDWGKSEKSKDSKKVIGKGFSLFWKAPAMPPNAASTAFLKFNEDGSLNILVSGMEIGQGYLTALAQIAAEVLTVPPNKIRVETPDTDRNPYEWQTVASHVTWGCGNAVRRAAEDAESQIFDLVARVYNFNKESLYLEQESVRCLLDKKFRLKFKDFVINGIQAEDGTWKGGPIIGRGMFMPEYACALSDPETGQGGHPNVHYTVGAAGLILEIDKETGRMKIKKAALAVDVGKAINPDLIRCQVQGGLVQGIATVLYEDMRFDENGKILNPNFSDYKIPTSLDIPEKIVPIIIEVPQSDGPYGVRGMAEHTMIPAAPLIANALDDALNIQIKTLPITAEKVSMVAKKIQDGDDFAT